MDLIQDVKEKDVGLIKPPTLPTPTSASTGFPEHRKRRVSAFKQKRQSGHESSATPTNHERSPTLGSSSKAPPEDAPPLDPLTAERKRIDQENRERLASMSPEEIEAARQELLNDLNPRVLQMLLKRANLDEPNTPSPFENSERSLPEPIQEPPSIVVQDVTAKQERGLAEGELSTRTSTKATKKVTFDEDAIPPEPPVEHFVTSSEGHESATASKDTTHFPSAPSLPDLDPSDPDFLVNLHSKFFPNLPADPKKMAWMAPLPTEGSPADRDSPYHPSQASLPVSALRFDFRGALLPPSVARQLPTSRGLHHHAEAPEAAGYTIPELARLARSAVPGQRCIAFQTLGRLLFRLGKGEFGIGAGGRPDAADGEGDDLAFALWRLVRRDRVIETLEEAAAVEEGVGHRGVRAYAIEALWLLEKGGWKEKWRGL